MSVVDLALTFLPELAPVAMLADVAPTEALQKAVSTAETSYSKAAKALDSDLRTFANLKGVMPPSVRNIITQVRCYDAESG